MLNTRKRSKLKSAERYNFYKTFGWLGTIAYRLRGDRAIRKYLATGKYFKHYAEEPYELISGIWMARILVSSKVVRSRIKDIHTGSLFLGKKTKEEAIKYLEEIRHEGN